MMASQVKSVPSEVILLKQKFQKGIYEWSDLPSILEADVSTPGVRVNKYAPKVKLVDPLKTINEDLIQSDKLSVDAAGEWEFCVCSIDFNYFDNRDELDTFFWPIELRKHSNFETKTYGEKIAIKEAFKIMDIDLTVNLDYYFKNGFIDQLEKDLGKKLDQSEMPVSHSTLEKELFYKLMCQIFGHDQDNDDEVDESDGTRVFIVKDFRFLSYGHDSTYATAQRGSRYLLFWFISS